MGHDEGINSQVNDDKTKVLKRSMVEVTSPSSHASPAMSRGVVCGRDYVLQRWLLYERQGSFRQVRAAILHERKIM